MVVILNFIFMYRPTEQELKEMGFKQIAPDRWSFKSLVYYTFPESKSIIQGWTLSVWTLSIFPKTKQDVLNQINLFKQCNEI